MDWGTIEETTIVEWLFVDHGEKAPYSVVTRCRLILTNDIAETLFQDNLKIDQHLQYVAKFMTRFVDDVKGGEFRVTIPDANEISETFELDGEFGDTAIFHFSIL